MTPKELLYVDDALAHSQFLKTQCQNAISSLSDPTLKQAVQNYMNTNAKAFQTFYGLV